MSVDFDTGQATVDPDTPGTGTRRSLATTPGKTVSPNRWPGTRALAVSPLADVASLNLDANLGQRKATWTFLLVDGVSGQRLGELHPIREPASITHDVTRVIKRSVRIALDRTDVAEVDPIRDRVLPYMHVAGVAYPLGRFMFVDPTKTISTGGDRGIYNLLDEMFRIDQQLEQSFASTEPVDQAVRALITGLVSVGTSIEATEFPAVGGWSAGTQRGSVLATLAVQGDYETPWMDNRGRFVMVRVRDPDALAAELDLDTGNRVIQGSIGETGNLLQAPNRFVVTCNSGSATNAEIVGVYDVPAQAPHSITNRGFIIPAVFPMQLTSPAQAKAMATNIGIRQTVFEQADLETVPDPRHDGYQIIHWQGRNWLELAWNMTCDDGAPMRHTMRRALLR